MTRYFIQSWKSNRCDAYRREYAKEALFCETSSAKFDQKGVKENDQIYAVFVRKGKLFLIGKMRIGKLTPNRKEAERLVGDENVFQGVRGAKYAIADKATTMQFDKQVSVGTVKRLRFVSDENSHPKFIDRERLDRQTLRQLREIESKSASQLDEVLRKMKLKMQLTNLL